MRRQIKGVLWKGRYPEVNARRESAIFNGSRKLIPAVTIVRKHFHCWGNHAYIAPQSVTPHSLLQGRVFAKFSHLNKIAFDGIDGLAAYGRSGCVARSKRD